MKAKSNHHISLCSLLVLTAWMNIKSELPSVVMNDKNMNEFIRSKLHLNQHFHLPKRSMQRWKWHMGGGGSFSVCFPSYIHWSSHSSAKVFVFICWACSLRCSWGKSAHSRTKAHLYSHSRMDRTGPLYYVLLYICHISQWTNVFSERAVQQTFGWKNN